MSKKRRGGNKFTKLASSYHEAGHCLINWMEELEPEKVSLKQIKKGDMVLIEGVVFKSERLVNTQEEKLKNAKASLGGPLAEVYWTNRRTWPSELSNNIIFAGSLDFDTANQLLEGMDFDKALEETTNAIQTLWPAVKGIAQELHERKTLVWDEVKERIQIELAK
jgi:hypothetical protein